VQADEAAVQVHARKDARHPLKLELLCVCRIVHSNVCLVFSTFSAHLEQAVVEVQADEAAVRVHDAQLPVLNGPAHLVLHIAVGACHQLACPMSGQSLGHHLVAVGYLGGLRKADEAAPVALGLCLLRCRSCCGKCPSRCDRTGGGGLWAGCAPFSVSQASTQNM